MTSHKSHGFADGAAKTARMGGPPAIGNDAANSTLSDTLDSLALGKEQQTLLDEIDKLRVCRIDQYIELPQIVVVGDQSSGKSSVLEAITRVPFPRSSERCTRFATQIKLRRAEEESFTINIIPDKNRSPADREAFKKFPEDVKDLTDFAEIMRLAQDTMWKFTRPDSFSSKDILSIEICGPTRPHLTVVDLPGFIHAARSKQSQADVNAIDQIANEYMKSRRTIILAIISAESHYENQIVLTKAQKYDPRGIRTLGIITKPDRIDSPAKEAMYVSLAENKEFFFKLGWHVLRNRTDLETARSWDGRNLEEKKFFADHENWAQLGEENLGIESLIKRLSVYLVQHVAREIPRVQEEIKDLLAGCRKDLDKIGNRDDTVEGMRNELYKLCNSSKKLVDAAVDGQYKDPYFSDDWQNFKAKGVSPRRLRARINMDNLRFAHEMKTDGHTVDIDETTGVGNVVNATKRAMNNNGRRVSRKEFIEHEVKPLLQKSAGEELLGDTNPLLVYELFRYHSKNWPRLANDHMIRVQEACRDLVHSVVQSEWPDDMQGKLWPLFLDEILDERLKSAEEEAARLYADRHRYAKSYDPVYIEEVDEWKRKFRAGMVEGENPMSLEEECLQKMLIHYKISYKVFMSNVILQVIERHLIDALGDIFSFFRIMKMDNEIVERIAAEDRTTRRKRQDLREKKSALETGLRILRGIAARKEMQVYDSFERDYDVESEAEVTKAPKSYRDTPEPAVSQRLNRDSVSTPARSSKAAISGTIQNDHDGIRVTGYPSISRSDSHTYGDTQDTAAFYDVQERVPPPIPGKEPLSSGLPPFNRPPTPPTSARRPTSQDTFYSSGTAENTPSSSDRSSKRGGLLGRMMNEVDKRR